MTSGLEITVGGLRTKNPVWVGSSELTMSAAGLALAVDSGAGAVVAKSVNESEAARRQLDVADYAFVGPDRRRRLGLPDPQDGLLNRSGLAPFSLTEWTQILADAQAYAARHDSIVIGSITLADPAAAAVIATRLVEAVPAVELNIGAPHGREVDGAVRQLTETHAVTEAVTLVRGAIDVPLIVKLPGQASDVLGLATAARAAGADAVTMVGRYPGFLPDLDGGAVMGSWGAWSSPDCLPMTLYWLSKAFLRDHELIGTNGARDRDDVLRFLASGARAVELVTALWVEGPDVVDRIVAGVADYLRAHATTVAEFVGTAVAHAREYRDIVADSPRPEPWTRWLAPPPGASADIR